MSCFLIVIFAYFMTKYVNGGCHDIYLLEEAKTRRLWRLSPGYGRITSLEGKCLDISTENPEDLTSNSQKVQIWDCDGDVSQQQWHYTSNNEIKNEKGHCLDIHEPDWQNNEPGSYVQIWECNGQDNQKWYIDGDTIKSSNGMCLDIGMDDVHKNGGVVQMWYCNGWDNQKWTLNAGDPIVSRSNWDETIIIGDRLVFEESAKWNECADGYAIAGFYKGDCQGIWCIEHILCATPDPSISQQCYQEDIKLTFDHDGTVSCKDGYFIRGIYNSNHETSRCDGLSCLEKLRCCKWDENEIEPLEGEGSQDWKPCFDAGKEGWCDVDDGEYITGLYRDRFKFTQNFAPLLKFDQKAKGYPMDMQTYIDRGGKYEFDCQRHCNPGGLFPTCGTRCTTPVENTNLDTSSNPTYYRFHDCGSGKIKIEYWWFYGHQYDCTGGAIRGDNGGEHVGDWERVIVEIDQFECDIDTVRYYQHGGYYEAPKDDIQTDGTHPIVFVGKIAHGSYHNQDTEGGGDIPGIACMYWEDYRDPNGEKDFLRTQNNLINLETSNDEWIVKNIDAVDGLSHPLDKVKNEDGSNVCSICNGVRDEGCSCDDGGCDW